MDILKKIYQRLLVEAMTGLSMGIFATVVAGTIIKNIGMVMGGNNGQSLISAGGIVIGLMGAGIGIGVSSRLNAPHIVVAAAAVTGYISSYATDIMKGNLINDNLLTINIYGEPITAFIAVYIVTEVGILLAGHTALEYLVLPPVMILSGTYLAMYIGKPISQVLSMLGEAINWSTSHNEIIMGAIIAVLMGMASTLPISSLALAMALNLSGAAAGAAAVGCCVNMIGFATASFRENRVEGFMIQSLGTSTVQMPNIIRKPLVWLPVLITSAVLGPVSIGLFHLSSDVTAAGLGACGCVAPIMTYETMIKEGIAKNHVLVEIILLQFILPAIMTWFISESMRNKGLIKENDMKIVIINHG